MFWIWSNIVFDKNMFFSFLLKILIYETYPQSSFAKKKFEYQFFRFLFLETLSLFLFIVCADIHTTKYYWFIDNFAAF